MRSRNHHREELGIVVEFYLVDWIAKLIVIFIKRCKQLCLASCCQNPDDFLIAVSLV